MLIKKAADLRESDVTPKETFLKRRDFLAVAGSAAVGVATNGFGLAGSPDAFAQNPAAQKLTNLKKSPFSTDEKLNSYKDITTYNNFYEFGLDKADPGKYAHTLKPKPWSVVVEGQCGKPGTYNIEDIMKYAPLEERIYRLRCVEAWSMVIPWIGYPLSEFLKRFEPTTKAKYVEFRTLVDTKQMPGQTEPALNWPYVEGLRMDEAMHPLTLLGLGLYGEVMPNQNGAPIRLVIPWKYGFKSIKSIVVRVRLLRQRQSAGRSPAVDAGQRAAPRRVLPPQDAAVQRLRRPGRVPLHRHGPPQVLLSLSVGRPLMGRRDQT